MAGFFSFMGEVRAPAAREECWPERPALHLNLRGEKNAGLPFGFAQGENPGATFKSR